MLKKLFIICALGALFAGAQVQANEASANIVEKVQTHKPQAPEACEDCECPPRKPRHRGGDDILLACPCKSKNVVQPTVVTDFEEATKPAEQPKEAATEAAA